MDDGHALLGELRGQRLVHDSHRVVFLAALQFHRDLVALDVHFGHVALLSSCRKVSNDKKGLSFSEPSITNSAGCRHQNKPDGNRFQAFHCCSPCSYMINALFRPAKECEDHDNAKTVFDLMMPTRDSLAEGRQGIEWVGLSHSEVPCHENMRTLDDFWC